MSKFYEVEFVSTGISISSINRIKELAEEKRFSEALEILDTQNLEKSINPQFLRISGEIFRENKRYYDSRKILLKSHEMSPQGVRIIFEIIHLYLELGYFTKANIYYEQYKFYATEEDTQLDFLEYMMKKAEGADFMELSAMLIPILERMPEDRWNFEAVLLYDKLGRKDKALEECKYILENFKGSVYVDDILKYIDDELDIDACFYVFPKEEQEEDFELYGDLIEIEEKLLEADHLRIHPPEARIMVEALDEEPLELIPLKDKKIKFSILKKNKIKDNVDIDEIENNQNVEGSDQTSQDQNNQDVDDEQKRENIQKEREAILNKILSKKLDKDKIKESALQMAKAVKEIDKEKAKNQVRNVADSVKENVIKAKDNVVKAKDVLEEAVGAKQIVDEKLSTGKDLNLGFSSDGIVDAIIDSMVEQPKKSVGEVVINQELDELIPDSFEAMTKEEIAEIEYRKAESERIELEALEAELNIKDGKSTEDMEKLGDENQFESVLSDTVDLNNNTKKENSENCQFNISKEQIEHSDDTNFDVRKTFDDYVLNDSYEKEKMKFIRSHQMKEEAPESLGFITVVQSDVDSDIRNAMPDAANILHQMIDNKEYYEGNDTTRFESAESYANHGFIVENYDFDEYKNCFFDEKHIDEKDNIDNLNQEKLKIQDIYVEEQILDFDDIVPEHVNGLDMSIDDESEDMDWLVKTYSEDSPIDDDTISRLRTMLIHDISLTEGMVNKLEQLKESRCK